jgi:NitT/TauT family transport system ATP-binding protein
MNADTDMTAAHSPARGLRGAGDAVTGHAISCRDIVVRFFPNAAA